MGSVDFKLVLIGQKAVGKTCIFNRYVYNEVPNTQMVCCTDDLTFRLSEHTLPSKKCESKKIHTMSPSGTLQGKRNSIASPLTIVKGHRLLSYAMVRSF